jgi:hypothetical protein
LGVEEARREGEALLKRSLARLRGARGAAGPKAALAGIADFVYRREN